MIDLLQGSHSDNMTPVNTDAVTTIYSPAFAASQQPQKQYECENACIGDSVYAAEICAPTRLLRSLFHRSFLVFHSARCPERGSRPYRGLTRSW